MAIGTVANLELGACNVEFGASGSETDLGFTKGGVVLTVTSPTVNITTDQFGQVILKQILVGRTATIRIPFAETDLLLMSKLIPAASHVIDSVDATKKKTIINTPIGKDILSAVANSLRLTKSIGGVASSNLNDRFRFFKAAPTGTVEFQFSIENQRIFATEWTAFADAAQDYALGVFGNEAAA